MRTVLLSLCVAAALQAATSGAARADDEQAKRSFLEGKKAYLEGRYDAAVVAFRAAAAIRPSPILDFNVGRCFEKLSKLDEAIAAYEKYLSTAKDVPNRAELKARVSKLKEERRRQRRKDPYEEIERSGPPSLKPPPASAPSAQAVPATRPASSGAAVAVPPRGGAPMHEAMLPLGAAPAAGEPGPRYGSPPAPMPPRRDRRPVYKQWWFWTACVAGAALTALFVTTVVYAAGGGSSGSSSPRALEVRF
jgi:hypothetical protein